MKFNELLPKTIGIYKINFPNGKIYIGLSKDIQRRLKEHLYGNKDTPCDNAIRKYFQNINEITFDILDKYDELNYEILSEREKYWIEYYESTDKTKGYNLTPGGLIIKGDCETLPWAKFTLKEIISIYNDLLDREKYPFIYQIAEKYQVTRNTIADINSGKTYHIDSYNYPIRDTKNEKPYFLGSNNPNASLSEETILQTISLILNSSKTFKTIAREMNLSESTVGRINKGDKISYSFCEYSYPLRNTQVKHSKIIEEAELTNIYNDLLNSSLSIAAIAKKYNRSKETLYRINKGEIVKYIRTDLSYPIRK